MTDGGMKKSFVFKQLVGSFGNFAVSPLLPLFVFLARFRKKLANFL
jgi:hypothetical protein